MRPVVFAVLTVIALLLVSACTSQEANDPASLAVKHLEARAAGDDAALRTLTCAAQESNVERMARSLDGLGAKLKDVACTFDGTGTVSCTGSIEVDYQGELRSIPVKNYSMTQEDGQWKWCGETE